MNKYRVYLSVRLADGTEVADITSSICSSSEEAEANIEWRNREDVLKHLPHWNSIKVALQLLWLGESLLFVWMKECRTH